MSTSNLLAYFILPTCLPNGCPPAALNCGLPINRRPRPPAAQVNKMQQAAKDQPLSLSLSIPKSDFQIQIKSATIDHRTARNLQSPLDPRSSAAHRAPELTQIAAWKSKLVCSLPARPPSIYLFVYLSNLSALPCCFYFNVNSCMHESSLGHDFVADQALPFAARVWLLGASLGSLSSLRCARLNST